MPASADSARQALSREKWDSLREEHSKIAQHSSLLTFQSLFLAGSCLEFYPDRKVCPTLLLRANRPLSTRSIDCFCLLTIDV